MKFTLRGILILLFISFVQVHFLDAQVPNVTTLTDRAQRSIERKGIGEIQSKKLDLRSDARQRVKELPSKLKNYKYDYDANPSLDQLIKSPKTKSEVTNKENDTRFVRLLGEWWSMPSNADLALGAELKRLRDSLMRQDSSKFRKPKLVRGQNPVTVFGWHHWWMGNRYQSYDFTLLTAVAYYSYDIDPYTGTYRNPEAIESFTISTSPPPEPEEGKDPSPPMSDFVARASEDNCSVLLTLSCHKKDDIIPFLGGNPYAQQNLIDSVLAILKRSGAHGVELNFEQVPPSHRSDFVKFVKRISYHLRNRKNPYYIAMSVPARNPFGVYNMSLYNDYVDFFLILGYEFRLIPTQGGDDFKIKKMPVSPLNYDAVSPKFDIRRSVNNYLEDLGYLESNKVILALPFYGTMWVTDGIDTEFERALTYSEIQFDYVQKYPNDVPKYEQSTTIMRFTHADSSRGRDLPPIDTTIFYEDIPSLREKYRFILDYGLGGVGVWALGFDEGFDHLWAQLSLEFTDYMPPENEKLLLAKKASSTTRKYGTVILTVLLYMAMFMALGFCFAILDRSTRQKLFINGSFRAYYLGAFSLLVLLLGGYIGIFRGNNSVLFVGVLLGGLLSWLILRSFYVQQAKQP